MSTSDKDGSDEAPVGKAKITASAANFIFISYPSAGARLLNGKVSNKSHYLHASQPRSAFHHTFISYGGTLKGRTKVVPVASFRVTTNGEVTLAPVELSNPPSEPPVFLQILLRVLLPARVRDSVLGDAQEAYNDMLKRSGRPWVATADYVKEVLYATVGGTWMRLERLISLLRRGS